MTSYVIIVSSWTWLDYNCLFIDVQVLVVRLIKIVLKQLKTALCGGEDLRDAKVAV